MAVGIALGSGSAKGLAHIGVLEVLEQRGVYPEVVTGTSMGALVGAAYASGIPLARIKEIALSINKDSIKEIFSPHFSVYGFVSQEKIRGFLQDLFGDRKIEELPKKFACIATDVRTGEEIIFREGSVVDAVLASISIPVLFPPVRLNERFLVDGGLVNPVPVDAARNLGADFVIAVNVISPLRRKRYMGEFERAQRKQKEEKSFMARLKEVVMGFFEKEEDEIPHILETFFSALDIMEEEIVFSHLRLNPPDILIQIDTSDFKSKEFYRAEEIILRGRHIAELIVDYIIYQLPRSS